jgi:hypothetical protein
MSARGRLVQTSAFGGLRFREAKPLKAMADARSRFAAANLADIKKQMSAAAGPRLPILLPVSLPPLSH